MGSEFVTHEQLAAAEDRLNRNIIETERVLRRDFTEETRHLATAIGSRIDKVDEHLSQQDTYMLNQATSKNVDWQRWILRLVGAIVLALILYYGLGIPTAN